MAIVYAPQPDAAQQTPIHVFVFVDIIISIIISSSDGEIGGRRRRQSRESDCARSDGT